MSIAGWHWNRIGKLAYLAINDFVAFVDVRYGVYVVTILTNHCTISNMDLGKSWHRLEGVIKIPVYLHQNMVKLLK